jgi:hypothetical protein
LVHIKLFEFSENIAVRCVTLFVYIITVNSTRDMSVEENCCSTVDLCQVDSLCEQSMLATVLDRSYPGVAGSNPAVVLDKFPFVCVFALS